MVLVTFPVFAADDADALLQGRLEAHINFLADDLLRGRQPGTNGYDIAAAYVASQFRQMGLQPAGTNGSYLQPVPIRRAWLNEGSATLELIREDETHAFRYVEEFYRGASLAHADSEVQAGMVFAGYGIDAPLLEYSDFEGLDLTGKVAVVLDGQPIDFPSEEGAHFSSGREIYQNLVSRGAIGVVIIHPPRTEDQVRPTRRRLDDGPPQALRQWSLDRPGERLRHCACGMPGVLIAQDPGDLICRWLPMHASRLPCWFWRD